MSILYCKLPGEIHECAGTFSDETSRMDENCSYWKAQDCSMILHKPTRGRCGETVICHVMRRVSNVAVLDLTLMTERGVNVQSGC